MKLRDLTIDGTFQIAWQTDRATTVEYGKDYFDKYVSYEGTEISQKINQHRLNTVKGCKTILDIGIGSGEFIKTCVQSGMDAFGYDVNPVGVKWLKDNNRWLDPYSDNLDHIEGVSMWDCIEHIEEPGNLLKRFHGKNLYVSLPIIANILNVHDWKHYRPNEHLWYFTTPGFVEFMKSNQHHCTLISDEETRAGRQDILTFTFEPRGE